GTDGVHRPSTITTDNSLYFSGTAQVSNAIQDILSDGFELGTNSVANANTSIYNYAVWKIPDLVLGSLSVDIVDSVGDSVTSPTFAFSAVDSRIECQNSSGIFGTSGQRIRITNGTASPQWS